MGNLKNSLKFSPATGISITRQQPPSTPPVTSTTVTYCPTSSPNCGNSMTCTSPCTISGLDPGTEYQFTVIPNNDCGSSTGCTWNNATAQTACESEDQFVCMCVWPTGLYHKYRICSNWSAPKNYSKQQVWKPYTAEHIENGLVQFSPYFSGRVPCGDEVWTTCDTPRGEVLIWCSKN